MALRPIEDPDPPVLLTQSEPQVMDRKESRALFMRIFPSIMLPMFLAVVDQTIVATALPAISTAFQSPERASWVIVIYLITATIAAPVYGHLGDVFGRRRLMLVALAIMSAASLVCALAPTLEVLLIGRALQGLGGGGLMTAAQALIGETVPPRERGRFQGYLAAVVVTSSTLGPVMGGVLTQYLGWRSIFIAGLPIAAAAAVLAMRLAAPPIKRSGSWRFDMTGLMLFVAFVCPFLLALEFARELSAGAGMLALLLLGISVVALVGLIAWESRTAHPFLPLPLFRKPAIWRSNALTVCHGATLVGLISIIPIFTRVVHGLSAGESGLTLVPLSAGVGLGSLVTGRLVAHTGRMAIFPSVGLVFAVGAILILAWQAPFLSTPALAGVLGVIGLFLGTTMAVVQITVQLSAGPGQLGAAAGSVQFCRAVGAALGTAIAAIMVFAWLTATNTTALNLFGGLLAQGPRALDVLDPAARAAAATSVSMAFQASFLVLAAFATTAMVLAWVNPIRRMA